jgi:hypothetical protein
MQIKRFQDKIFIGKNLTLICCDYPAPSIQMESEPEIHGWSSQYLNLSATDIAEDLVGEILEQQKANQPLRVLIDGYPCEFSLIEEVEVPTTLIMIERTGLAFTKL